MARQLPILVCIPVQSGDLPYVQALTAKVSPSWKGEK